ncbi:MAG: alpha-mannosidase, partial [Chloroflexota bacterium]
MYVVPHTHWDREWYQPHELFRWRLVRMIDELLDLLERDPAFRCFTLDGQTVVIEDYLELRPEQEPRLRALVQAGRLTIGPWWVQPDEFLPSGESHIRSLLRGIRAAERFGGSLCIGHCADQFGHIAQMPQIMAGLGLSSACLWRGVSDRVPGWSFWWEAPDGTRLPVLYLRHSYSNGWRLPAEPDELLARVRLAEEGHAPHEPLLLMNGTDHARAQADLPAVLAGATGRGYAFRIASLPEYEAALLAAGVGEHVHRGELRSPDRSNVLAGVLSARMTIKQRDFAVSAALERYAEPLELLAHLHTGYDGLPALNHAWRLLLENSPHDSICGCSADQTHREMLPRYDRAEQLARQVAREAVTAL